MRFKLLLTNKSYPDTFKKINLPSDVSESCAIAWVEKKIITAIQGKNPKISIESIEYCDIAARFSSFENSNYCGLIVEETVIPREACNDFESRGYYVYKKDSNFYAQRPLVYTIMTAPVVAGRNVFVSQSIFPTLIDYMKTFHNSPCYDITNHPVYFINIVNDPITALSIIEPLYALNMMGICYVDVFGSTLSIKKENLSLKEHLLKFDSRSFNDEQTSYSCESYEIDFRTKSFRIKTKKLAIGEYLKRGANYVDFNGSSEKFYWMEMLPATLKAFSEKFFVNYEDFDTFCKQKGAFSPTSEKFSRFETILAYIKKLNLED